MGMKLAEVSRFNPLRSSSPGASVLRLRVELTVHNRYSGRFYTSVKMSAAAPRQCTESIPINKRPLFQEHRESMGELLSKNRHFAGHPSMLSLMLIEIL